MLTYVYRDGKRIANPVRSVFQGQTDEIKEAADCVMAGGIAAIQGETGFYLVCQPIVSPVKTVRALKKSMIRPFAFVYPDLLSVQKCSGDTGAGAGFFLELAEEKELAGRFHPIVLLKKEEPKYDEVTREFLEMGAVLASGSLMTELTAITGPLVITSLNVHDEPMVQTAGQALEWLIGACIGSGLDRDVFLLSEEREMKNPQEPAVVRFISGRRQTVRIGQGLAGVRRKLDAPGTVASFAAGAAKDGTFVMMDDESLFVSGRWADLSHPGQMALYNRQVPAGKYKKFYADFSGGISTAAAGYTAAHPGAGPWIHIQHHKAHAASVLFEMGSNEKTICMVLDGAHVGEDKSLWGGEMFLTEGRDLHRIGSILPVRMIGDGEGELAAESLAYSYLASLDIRLAFGGGVPEPEAADKKPLSVRAGELSWLNGRKADLAYAAVLHKIGLMTSSSMEAFFTVVAALLGFTVKCTYEGEALDLLTQKAVQAKTPYHLRIPVIKDPDVSWPVGDTFELFDRMVDALSEGVPPETLAAGVLVAVTDWIFEMCDMTRKLTDINVVALAGSCFNNGMLAELVVDRLEGAGFTVLLGERIPAGDEGVAFGEMYGLSGLF